MMWLLVALALVVGWVAGRYSRPGTPTVVDATPAPADPPTVTPAKYRYDPDTHKLIRRCVIIGLLLTTAVSSHAGNIAVMDPFTKGPKNLVPGAGIAFTGSTISATGVPAGGVSAVRFDNRSTAQAATDAAQNAATAAAAAVAGSALQSSGVSKITRNTSAPTATIGAIWVQPPSITAATTAKNLISADALDLNNHNLMPYANEPLVTFNGNQYVAFFNSVGNVAVGKRTLPAGAWSIVDTGKTSDAATAPVGWVPNASDQHDVASIGIDPDGYIHIIYGRHAEPLSGYYIVSDSPESIATWTTKTGMTGTNENSFTYPTFVNNGSNLFCFYRNGGSGDGELYLNKYNHATQTWTAVAAPLVNSVAASKSPYWEATTASDGSLHLSWNWRTTAQGENTKYSYAKSVDSGVTWQDADGNTLNLPVLYADTPVFDDLASPHTTYRATNSNSIAVDADGNPHIAYGRAGSDGIFQYYHAWHDGTWHINQVTAFESGTGVSRPAIGYVNGQTIIVGRSPSNGYLFAAVTPDGYEYRFHRIGTDFWLGTLELNIDFSLLAQDSTKLHVLAQQVGGTTGATSLYTLEVNPSTWGAGITYAQFFVDVLKMANNNGVWRPQTIPYNPPTVNVFGRCGEGEVKKYLSGAWKCAADSTGAEGVTTFLNLTDTPSAYTSSAGKVLQVNSGATAVEFGQVLTTTATPQFARIGIGEAPSTTNKVLVSAGDGAIGVVATATNTAALQGTTTSTGAGVIGSVSGSTSPSANGLRGQGGGYSRGVLAYQFSSGLAQNSFAPVAYFYRDITLNGFTATDPIVAIDDLQATVSASYGPQFRTKKGTAVTFQINSDSTTGVNTTSPGAAFDINSATGNNLQLTYNDSNGSAANKVNFAVSSSGDLTITPSGGDIALASTSLSTKTIATTVPVATTYGATTTVDLSAGHYPKVTLTGNTTLAFSNPVAGQTHKFRIKQDGTGSRTVTWPSTGLVCTFIGTDNLETTTAPAVNSAANTVTEFIIVTTSTTTADCYKR